VNPNIIIRNARLHNLKNVTLEIPKNQLVVMTGLSGSGKPTLAFDILHKESLRKLMESFGLVTGGLSKPPVDPIVGLPPSINIDQHLDRHPSQLELVVEFGYCALKIPTGRRSA
jgi:excinuclease ABC subunit A